MKSCFTGSVQFDLHQLETLVAIVDEGGFEAAARRLQVSPSAISQRVRALERAAGTVLVRRASPAGVTSAGEPLLRFGRQLQLLAAEAAAELEGAGALSLPVAVNADSLATWFRPVLGAVAERSGAALRLHVEDQAQTHELLRRGEVLAAVTDAAEPVQGCTVIRLGEQHYLAGVAPGLLARHQTSSVINRHALPMVVYNEKDRLQHLALAAGGHPRPAVIHRVPTTADFRAAIEAGLGWGMLPESQFETSRSAGLLVPLPGVDPVTVVLHWQRWRVASDTLDALDLDVRHAAGALAR